MAVSKAMQFIGRVWGQCGTATLASTVANGNKSHEEGLQAGLQAFTKTYTNKALALTIKIKTELKGFATP